LHIQNKIKNDLYIVNFQLTRLYETEVVVVSAFFSGSAVTKQNIKTFLW